jgi:hypothetical protein
LLASTDERICDDTLAIVKRAVKPNDNKWELKILNKKARIRKEAPSIISVFIDTKFSLYFTDLPSVVTSEF